MKNTRDDFLHLLGKNPKNNSTFGNELVYLRKNRNIALMAADKTALRII